MISNNEDIEINIRKDIEECKDCEICVEELSYECVICLNKVEKETNFLKFNCGHKKYMHNSCIVNVDKCPLCRKLSNYTYFQNFIVYIQNGIYFIFSIFYFAIFLTIIYLILRFITI